MYNKKDMRCGFTLVEMIVAIGLFTVITVVGLGVVADSYRTSRLEREGTKRLFSIERAVDIMVRELQAGTLYDCDASGDCVNGGTSLAFVDSEGEDIEYRYASGVLERVVDGDAAVLAGVDTVSLSNFVFYVQGSGEDDGIQPRVRILAQGNTNEAGEVTPFSLDVFVSQRAIDG